MTTIPVAGHRPGASPPQSLPPLESGDHLDQRTFHERYEAMPEDFRAELIGGIVFIPSPLKRPHGRMHVLVIRWLGDYEDATPSTEVLDNATTILGPDSEPQPDLSLFIVPGKGGQTRDEDDYLAGTPELIVEVASTTAAIDLHRKRDDYQQAGVKEYIVVLLRPASVLWWAAKAGKFVELPPGPDGILRSEVFPGLWLDPGALLRHDTAQVKAVLRQGLASPEHAAFVAKLAGQTP